MGKEKKPSRIARKAEGEIKIVRRVKEELLGALRMAEYELDEITARVNRYSDELVALLDAKEIETRIERAREDLDEAEGEHAAKKTQITLLNAARKVIGDLLGQLETVYRMGWYRQLVRTVPEKKLGALACLEHDDDLTELQALATAVLETITKKRERAEQDQEKYRRQKKALEDQAARSKRLREQNSVKGKMDAEQEARARARSAANAAARSPMPVNATVQTPAEVSAEAPAATTAQNKA